MNNLIALKELLILLTSKPVQDHTRWLNRLRVSGSIYTDGENEDDRYGVTQA